MQFQSLTTLLLCAILWLGTLPASAQDAAQAPANLRLFLLIGQSNMAGRGRVEAEDKIPHPRVWMLTKDLKWVPAKDPLHFDKGSAGVGLASEFARTLVKSDGELNIGLIPCAVGGTSLGQWQPDGELYQNAIERTREAMKHGELAGILWHQGESDRKPDKVATYPTRFAAMASRLREDLKAPTVPLLVGELGRFRTDQDAFNAMLPELVRGVPHSALVTAEDLADKGDNLHFGSPALREFGKRYAAAWLKMREMNHRGTETQR